MVRPHLRDIPQVPFPEGFGIRPMREGEGVLWTDIQRDTEPHFPIEDDLFMKQFGDDLPATLQRCFLIIKANGSAVGTISGWYKREYMGQEYGQIHWVAVRPAYQGHGLAKAGMSYTLGRLAEWHERAMLDTSTARLAAIRMYLNFGFVPNMAVDGAEEAWAIVRENLQHPGLKNV
jgi:GNAT superfamily N-acetyltransferase